MIGYMSGCPDFSSN